MAIIDCTICGKDLDHGPVIAHGSGFAHGGCVVARQFRDRKGKPLHGCGDCASCEEGHPERCKRPGCGT